MSSIAKIKDKIDLIIKNGGAEDTFLVFLFSHIRIVLEKEKQKSHYPHLAMVCDWYQHPEIDRSREGYTIIQKIGELIIDDLANDDADIERRNANLIRSISATLGMNKLKNELKIFFVNNNINPILVEEQNWNRIIINIANDLKERPIRLPENKEYFQNMFKQLEEKAQELQVTNWEQMIPIGISIFLKDNGFYWKIEMNSFIILTGALIK